MQKVAWPRTMVQVENGRFMMSKAERSAMPVMMPGRAIGRMKRSDSESLPKKRARESAAAASVPNISASSVAMSATFRESSNGGQMSGRSNHAVLNQWRVYPGGGN